MFDHDFVAKVTDRLLSEKDDSAWDKILPEFRSEYEGWTKAGEFACPNCGTSIGKNLKGQQPFALASEHKKAHGDK